MIIRLAEDSKTLYNKIVELSKTGVVFEGKVLYPVLQFPCDSVFYSIMSERTLEIILYGGRGIRETTDFEKYKFYLDFEKDVFIVGLLSRWGGSHSVDSKIVKFLHMPRGNSFKKKD